MNKNSETKNSLKTLKFRNRKLVLAFMRMSSAVSVNEISRATGLSKMTVHKIIDHYMKEGMISLAGKGESTDEGGKKPNLFSFNPNCRFIFAVRLSGRRLASAVVNLKGEMLIDFIRHDVASAGFDDVVGHIGEDFKTLVAAAGLKPDDCLAAVVGCDGVVNVKTGCCRVAYSSGWRLNMPLRESMERVLPPGLPIHIDSWWRHLAHGEVHYSGEERRQNFFLIGNCGDYVSGGMVVDGMVCHGATGLAGEIGHMIVAPGSDARCVCGGNGCLEAVVAPTRMLERARERRDRHPPSSIWGFLDGGRQPGEALAIAAGEGDALAREILEEAAGYFAIAVNNIVCVCDPGLVVFYGDAALAKDWFLERIRARVNEITLRGVDKCTDIELTVSEADIGLVGAAHFITDCMFARD